MNRKITAAVIINIIIFLSLTVPVFAIANPDSPGPSIDRAHANQYLLENGDMFIYFEYYIPYATPPDESIDQAFTFRLYDTDMTTYLATGKTYAYEDNGYNFGVCSFYFSAANNPGWGEAYYIKLTGNPVYFSTPLNYTFMMYAEYYSTFSTQADNKLELKANLIDITQHLQSEWGIVLLDQADVGMVLSIYGELYYREVIPGLQIMCPALFLYQVSDPVYTPRTWSGVYVSSLENQWVGTPYEDGFAALGGLFGMNTQIIGALIVMVLGIFIVGASAKQTGSINSGLMDWYSVMIVAGLWGLFPFAIVCFIDFLAWVYIGYIWILRR